MKGRLAEKLRIIWVIAAKDIVGGIKNKNVLGGLISVIFLMVFYKAMPLLVDASEPPTIFVYDEDNSSLVAALEDSGAVELRAYPPRELMKEKLAIKDDRDLGFVVPADFDRRAAAGETVKLEGYVTYWLNDEDAEEVASSVEQTIASVTGYAVRIDAAGNIVYAPLGQGGQSFLLSILLALAISMLGVIIIPHLMIEEKQAKTLDALLVSPAGVGQVVAGKALAGFFYCLLAAAMVLIVNASIVIHWWLAILAVLCGALFPIGLGLLFGVLFEVRQQLTLWGFLSLQVLLIPAFLVMLEGLVPADLIAVLRWVPTAALGKVFRVACSLQAPPAEFLPEVAVLLGSGALMLAIVAWFVRRSDR